MRGAARLQRFPKIDQVLLRIFAERPVIGAKFQQAGERAEARRDDMSGDSIHFLIRLVASQYPLVAVEYQKPDGKLVECVGQSLAFQIMSTTAEASHDTDE